MVLVCRSQVDSRPVCWRNGCWTLWRTLHGCCLTDQQVNPPPHISFSALQITKLSTFSKEWGRLSGYSAESLCSPIIFPYSLFLFFLNFIYTKLLTGLVLLFSSSTLFSHLSLFLASIYNLPYSQSACCRCYLQV